MNLVFSTDDLEPSRRYAAWQGAICDVYVHVDVNAEERSDYHGFIREARFGAVTMTDVLLSEQLISRREMRCSDNRTSVIVTAPNRASRMKPW